MNGRACVTMNALLVERLITHQSIQKICLPIWKLKMTAAFASTTRILAPVIPLNIGRSQLYGIEISPSFLSAWLSIFRSHDKTWIFRTAAKL